MPADPDRLRFFADESVLGLGKVLAIARHDCVHVGHPLIPEVELGARDTVWMPHVAARDLIVIARDRHIRTKPAELALLREHALRVFWIAGKRDLSTWDTLVRIVRRWREIERTIADRGPGPWFVAIDETRLTELTV